MASTVGAGQPAVCASWWGYPEEGDGQRRWGGAFSRKEPFVQQQGGCSGTRAGQCGTGSKGVGPAGSIDQ